MSFWLLSEKNKHPNLNIWGKHVCILSVDLNFKWWRKMRPEGSEQRDKEPIHPLTEGLLSERGWEVLIDLVGDGENTHIQTHTPTFSGSTHILPLLKLQVLTDKEKTRLFTYSMMRSFEVFGLSANSWQLRTLNPYPSQTCPLISADLMVIGSKPVFSTLKVLLRVKFGSLTFVSEIKGFY